MTTIRPLADDDATASRQLRHEAFGSTIPDEPARVPRRGQHWLGAYVGDRLVARAADREYEAWFGGTRLLASGMAGVTIQSEHRGSGGGVLDALVTANLRSARERGAVVSTMFPTAVGIYRRHGFERITELQTVRLPVAALAGVKRPGDVGLRRAEPDDFPAIHALYEEWAAAHHGALSRTGEHFTSRGDRYLRSWTAVTVAEDDEGLCAYAAWNRGSGHSATSTITVGDLRWRRPGGARAILAMLATNGPVVGSITLETWAGDPLRMLLPGNAWPVVDADVYGLKLLDVVAAFERRTWDPALRCALPLRVVDDVLTENSGGWLLELADGRASLTRAEADDALVLTSRGLAVAYAGAADLATLRTLGLAAGDASRDAAWASVLGGRRPAVADYF